MRTLARRFAVAAALLFAGGLIFSPLLATVLGTPFEWSAVGAAFHGCAAPSLASLGSALVSAAVAVCLGTPFAILVARARTRLRRGLWSLGLLVLIVPPYMAAESWIVLLGPAGKLSKPLALALGWGPHSADPIALARYMTPGWVYTWGGVGAVMGGCLFPVVALAVASALRRTDRRVFEAARLVQGAAGVRRLAWRILLPPVTGGALLVFAATLTEFAVPQVLRVRTLGETIYERIQEGDLSSAAAVSLPLMPLVMGVGGLGAFLLLRARVASLAGLEGEIPKFCEPNGGLQADLRAGVASLVALTPGLFLSVTSLAWLAATAQLPAGSALGGHKVLRASGLVAALRGAWDLAHNDAVRTVALAGLTALLATVFSVLLARLVSGRVRGWWLGLLGGGLAVPAPIVGLGLIILWDHGWSGPFYQSLGIVMLGWLARFLPLTILLVQSALARVPRELEQAAALAGRGLWERFRCAILPNAWPGLAAAWVATYVLSATEFSATLLLAPPGSPLLAPSVVNLMRRGQDPAIAACQFLLLSAVALPLAALVIGSKVRVRAGARRGPGGWYD